MTLRTRFNGWCLVGLLLVGAGCGPQDDSAYKLEVDAWHAQRIERLRSETGWLTLVGLHPLGQGRTVLGSAAGLDVVLTAAAPSQLGTVTLTGTHAEFAAATGVQVHRFQDGAVSDELFSGGVIKTDAEGTPDMLAAGSLVFYVIQRGEKFFLRVKDRQAKTRREFRGIDRYPVDQQWRVTAKLVGEPGTMRVANVLGQVAPEPSPGTLVFELAGQEYRLRPTGAPGEGLFVVFSDGTSGRGTYPGGRFLTTDPPAADGTVILDFNRAYNPPCVFSEYATCPLPGLDNMLLVEVKAGEKMWGVGH
jgi:uncharacterized protein (DUF1684 family)